MRIRPIMRARRGVTAVAIATTLAFTVAGCGGEAGKQGDTGSSAESPRPPDAGKGDDGGSEVPEPSRTLAVVKGSDELVLTLTSAQRDSGGFVTVNGQVKNTGSESFYGVSAWRGNEQEIVRNSGRSVGGATLVDNKGKKRYYVLRDTEGRCLCTTGVSKVEAGRSVAVFMQFPAPPEKTTGVDFQLPGFPSTPIELTS